MIIRHASAHCAKKIQVIVLIEGSLCEMEVDIGASMTVVSWTTIKKAVPGLAKKHMKFQRVQLKDYQGNHIPVIGSGYFQVKFKECVGPHQLTVVDGALPSLLGLDWFNSLGLGVIGIHTIQDNSIEELIKKFADVFNGSLGKYTGTPISFSLDPKSPLFE